MRVRERNGRFKRTRDQRHAWTPDIWDDGYLDADGRMRVFRPDFPRSTDSGFALRAHVVWWLATGDPHPAGMDLHHQNEDRLDDRLENLRLLPHGVHSRLHNATPTIYRQCVGCGITFAVPKHKPQKKFCTVDCYHATPRTAETKLRIGEATIRRWDLDPIPEQVLRTMYEELSLNAVEIGKRLGISKNTVYARLRLYGIHVRSKSEAMRLRGRV